MHHASGTFRVDRKRALEKLSQYQHPLPSTIMGELARAAAAGGAKRVAFSSFNGFEMRFDGRALSEREFASPLEALFLENPDRRGRHLASGLLGLCRLSNYPVELTATVQGRRRTVLIAIYGDDSIREASGGGDEIVISSSTVQAPWTGAQALRGNLELFQPRCSFAGEAMARFNPRGPGFWFQEEGVRGWIGPAVRIDRHISTLRLYHLGVRAGRHEAALEGAQVEVWLEDDEAELDLSGGFVLGARWKRVLKVLRRQTGRLVARLAAGQRARMRKAWELMEKDPLARRCWARRMEKGPGADPERLSAREAAATLRGGQSRRRRLAEVLWTAHVTHWLRDLLEQGRSERAKLDGVLVRAVEACPLFFGGTGRLYTCAGLKKTPAPAAAALSRGVFGKPSGEDVWLSGRAEAAALQDAMRDTLRRWAPSAISEEERRLRAEFERELEKDRKVLAATLAALGPDAGETQDQLRTDFRAALGKHRKELDRRLGELDRARKGLPG